MTSPRRRPLRKNTPCLDDLPIHLLLRRGSTDFRPPPYRCRPRDVTHPAVASIGLAGRLILHDIAVGALLLRWTSETLMPLRIHQGRELLHFAVPRLTDACLVGWRIDPIVVFQHSFFVVEPPPIHRTDGNIAIRLIVASFEIHRIYRVVVRGKTSRRRSPPRGGDGGDRAQGLRYCAELDVPIEGGVGPPRRQVVHLDQYRPQITTDHDVVPQQFEATTPPAASSPGGFRPHGRIDDARTAALHRRRHRRRDPPLVYGRMLPPEEG